MKNRLFSCVAIVMGLVGFMELPQAQAQLVIPNPDGSSSFIYPGRLSPWSAPNGPVLNNPFTGDQAWMGYDGQPHGNYRDASGNMHFYAPNPMSGPRQNSAPSHNVRGPIGPGADKPIPGSPKMGGGNVLPDWNRLYPRRSLDLQPRSMPIHN